MSDEDKVFLLQLKSVCLRLREAGREHESNMLRYAAGIVAITMNTMDTGMTFEDAEAYAEALKRLRIAVVGLHDQLPKVDEPTAPGTSLN